MNQNRVAVVEEQTALAMSVLRFGEESDTPFKPIPEYRGALVETFTDDEFIYRDAREMPPDFNMPLEAWRIFFAVYENPAISPHIVQVVIADELEPNKEIDRAKDVAVGGVVAAIGIAALLATAALAIAPLLLRDPKLIIVLDDGTWISICEWVS